LTATSSRGPIRPGAPTGTNLLGIDLGDRRIGVAVAHPATGGIRPLATIQRRDTGRDAVAIDRLVREHDVGELVVGLPLHLDGREGEQVMLTREWARSIADLLRLPVRFRDERRTSLAAEARIPRLRRGHCGGAPSGRATRAHRARIDREAAALILQAELDARAEARA
jgi:putative Holliday junction resolvase